MEFVSPEGLRLNGRCPMEVQNKGQQISDQALVTIHRDISGYPPDHGSLHIDTLDASVSGTRSACINAPTLALADAGFPMRDLVTSCSSGYLNSTPLPDLNYVEDSAGAPDLTE